MTRPKTKILVDGGDPQETRQVKERWDLSMDRPPTHIKELQTISPLVGDAGVSIEVFSDEKTTAQEMFSQGQEMFSWIPNAYIKYPCTGQFPASLYTPRVDQRGIQSGPYAGQLEWHDASLAMKHH